MARYRPQGPVSPNLEVEFRQAAKKLKGRDELDMGFKVLKEFWNDLTRRESLKAAEGLEIGDRVWWRSSRTPFAPVSMGVIEKLATKTARVKRDDGQVWNVAVTLLQKGSPS